MRWRSFLDSRHWDVWHTIWKQIIKMTIVVTILQSSSIASSCDGKFIVILQDLPKNKTKKNPTILTWNYNLQLIEITWVSLTVSPGGKGGLVLSFWDRVVCYRPSVWSEIDNQSFNQWCQSISFCIWILYGFCMWLRSDWIKFQKYINFKFNAPTRTFCNLLSPCWGLFFFFFFFRTLVLGLSRIDVTLKLVPSTSLMSLLYSKQFQVLRTVKNPSHGYGWDRRDFQTSNFRWAWCQYSHPVYIGLINTIRFFRNCYFGCGSNHMY